MFPEVGAVGAFFARDGTSFGPGHPLRHPGHRGGTRSGLMATFRLNIDRWRGGSVASRAAIGPLKHTMSRIAG